MVDTIERRDETTEAVSELPSYRRGRRVANFIVGVTVLSSAVVLADPIGSIAGDAYAKWWTERLVRNSHAAEVMPDAAAEFSTAVSWLVGKDVDVYCFLPENLRETGTVDGRSWQKESAYLYSSFQLNPIIFLDTSVCEDITSYQQLQAEGGVNQGTMYDATGSLHVISHASAHVSGFDDEGQANCKGAERFTLLANLLGMPELTDFTDPYVFVRSSPQPARYHAAGC